MNVEAGPSYLFQKLAGEKDNFLALRGAERFEWAFSSTAKLYEAVEYFLSMKDTDKSLINAEAGVEAALTTRLSLVFSVQDRFDSQPAEDRKNNDLFVVTALKASL